MSRESRPGPGVGVIICAALGSLPLLVGLASLPGVLVRFGNEDTNEVIGRLICVGCEFALGVGLMVPLVRALMPGGGRRQDRYDDRDW